MWPQFYSQQAESQPKRAGSKLNHLPGRRLISISFCIWIVILGPTYRGKLMKRFATLVLPILTLSLTSPMVTAQTADKAVIDKFIAAQAKREGGEEPDDVRETIEGDLNHDGTADVAVLYTIEGQGGSNNYIQYLAVFVRKKTGLVFAARTAAGGKNRRSIDLTSIKDNVMYFDTTGYTDRDPSCCPSIKGKTSFTLTGRKLVEKRR